MHRDPEHTRFATSAVILAGLAVVSHAHAGEKATAAKDLPGVVQPKPIVKPLPEHTDEPSTPDTDGFVQVGDWRVKVSGYTRVDVGTGNLPRDKR